MTNATARLLVGAMLIALPAGEAAAAVITWGPPQAITGDSDVSTNGTLVGAVNIGPQGVAATTVNGTTFAPLVFTGTSVTSGPFTFALATGFGAADTPTATPPFGALSAPYQALLSSFGGNPATAPFTLTLAGLTVGDSYQFQWWANTPVTLDSPTTATAGNSVTLQTNPGNIPGNVGQFAIGTFIADATTQLITFDGTLQPILNGAQLRNVTDVAAVPEPAALGLLGLGLLGLAAARRRRRG
jgi:hypothetical protein